MDITPLVPSNKKNITGYGGGMFKINNEPHNGGIIILPNTVLPWSVKDASEINAESLLPFFSDGKIEILIIGCGENHIPLPIEITRAFRTNGINIEAMSTGAACRTYNVLLTEGREVAAALIPV